MTYTMTPDFDGQFDPELTVTQATNAVQKAPYIFEWRLVVAATNEAYFMGQVDRELQSDAAQWRVGSGLNHMAYDTSTADLTGTITVSLKIRASNATATQTFRVYSFVVRKIAST